jgi:hypothetical protein
VRASPKDELVIAGLAAGQSVPTVATAVGMSERNVRRKLADGEFAARVRAAKAQVVAEAVARLGAMMGAALERLAVLVDRGDDRAALGAARTVLDMGFRGRTAEEMQRQIDDLVGRVEKLTADKWRRR